jgi:hypothetical protein
VVVGLISSLSDLTILDKLIGASGGVCEQSTAVRSASEARARGEGRQVLKGCLCFLRFAGKVRLAEDRRCKSLRAQDLSEAIIIICSTAMQGRRLRSLRSLRRAELRNVVFIEPLLRSLGMQMQTFHPLLAINCLEILPTGRITPYCTSVRRGKT